MGRIAHEAALLVGVVGLCGTALAQPGSAPAAQPPPVAAARSVPGLFVVVKAGAARLDPYRIRHAIEQELGVPVLSVPDASAAGTLSVIATSPTDLEMTYDGKDGRRHSRTLELPDDPNKRVETVALVAGNLARDETGQLIEELRPPPEPAPSEAPVPPPAAENAGEPEPSAAPEGEGKPKAALPAKAEQKSQAPTPLPAPTQEATTVEAPELIDTPLNLSLFHPLALYSDSEKRRFRLELGFAYSRVGGVSGGALNLFLSRIDRGLTGVQVGGIGTLVGGTMRGASLGGIFSHDTADTEGLLAAGVWSYSSGALDGATISGIAAWQGGPLAGFQGAGVANLMMGPVTGGALAGVVNLTGPLRGAALSGVGNITRGRVDGAQVAGVVNIAHDVDGVQIALVNVGRRVRGVQIGLVNVADEVDGASIALAPIVKDGHQRLVFWTAPGHALANIGAKFENGPVYTLIGIGYEPKPEASDIGGGSGRYYPTAALGLHADVGPAFVELDAQYQSAQRIEDGEQQHHSLALRPKLGWQPFDSLGIFAGFAAERRLQREEDRSFRGFAGIQVF